MKIEKFDYATYLTNKKIIDDHSLNITVWNKLLTWLLTWPPTTPQLRILEIGAGVGTMIERLLETGALQHCTYTAVEIQADFAAVAKHRLINWCKDHNGEFIAQSVHQWTILHGETRLDIQWHCLDAQQVAEQFPHNSFDLLLAHAVIDLLPVPQLLPHLLSCLAATGAYYFSVNYAGETVFLPPHPEDKPILAAYHQDMDKRFAELAWQASKTGYLLGAWLQNDYAIHNNWADGDSSWHLSAEHSTHTHFIGNILDTIESALPDFYLLDQWLAVRREQLSKGILRYSAVNHDYFGCLN